MLGRTVIAAAPIVALALASTEAGAIVMGSGSSLHSHTVRIASHRDRCSGVAIARRLVATAAHCARGVRVIAGGTQIRVVAVTRSGVLDDGRRVSARGDAAILRLATPLPFSISPAPIGDGAGETFVVAGYGTRDERHRGAFGVLREAQLVAAGRFALVDPQRQGSIGASACYGDSGGPVLRGGMLVGVITRAVHPSPRIACGHVTRWAPLIVSGAPRAVASEVAAEGAPAFASEASLFGRGMPVAEPRRHHRRKKRHRRRY